MDLHDALNPHFATFERRNHMFDKYLKRFLPFAIFLCLTGWLSAQTEVSLWKGFKRYDFTFEGRKVRLIMPHPARTGNPWLWRARFPDWHTEADSILVSEGYHLLYIDTDNMYGSPRAVEVWDGIYDFVRQQYHLHDKVALAGVSRGGLFVYNWAKKNPEKVACLYAEAPVCDFKSWPGGFGKGKGSPNDWEKLKQEYGFADDAVAKAYANNPLDQLDAMAKAKVPVLHMIGLQDKIVPPDENTFLLIKKYQELGGIATVVPCTEDVQNLEGHHFPIETPRLVADFIKYHCEKTLPLDAAAYHELRRGLPNAQLRFERDKKGRVAFLGGSITHNPGWRDSICTYLNRRFPDTEFEFIAAGIPSMGSTPAAFRLQRDVLSKGPIDLLFEEAAVNDATNGRSTGEMIRGMEGIVRHVRNNNPAADVVIMHFVDPDKMADYRSGVVPEVIREHEAVAAHYQIPTINLAREVTSRIDHGEFTWEKDFKDLHPSPFGQVIYARSMIQFLDRAFADAPAEKLNNYIQPDKLHPYCYDRGQLLDIASAETGPGWSVDPSWAPKDGTGTRPNYVNVPMLLSETPGSTLTLPFNGDAVGIAVAAGQDAGMLHYRIDGLAWQTIDLFTRWSTALHLPWYYTLAAGLPAGAHTLEIRVAETKNEKSKGHACRIRYFFRNGN